MYVRSFVKLEYAHFCPSGSKPSTDECQKIVVTFACCSGARSE